MCRTRGYKRYSPEFKREALNRASEDGATDKQVCEELEISGRQVNTHCRHLSVDQIQPGFII
jgi:transposase-like protein